MTADSVSVTVKIADMPAVRAIVAENAEQTAEITRLREELTRLLRTIDEQSYPAAERALKAEADAKRERAAAKWLAEHAHMAEHGWRLRLSGRPWSCGWRSWLDAAYRAVDKP